MIDFQNGSVFKLTPHDPAEFWPVIGPLLIEGETALSAYKAVRDFVVFTSKRLIVVNVQGITGKKKDFSSLPYRKIQAFSVETAGRLDLDAELELWFSGLGRVRLEFRASSDIAQIARTIGTYVL